MEVKKSKRVRLENYSSTFFLVGLVVSLFVVLLAFEFKSERVIAKLDMGISSAIWNNEMVPITERTKPKPMKVKIIATKIKLVDNNTEILDEYSTVEDLSGNLNWEPDYEFDDELDVEPVVPFPEIEPKFPGGTDALLKFLASNITYPESAIKFREEGTVYVQFTVSSKGIVKEVFVLRGVSPVVNSEALRVVKMMPKWTPAQQGIRKVATYFRIPIKFTLSN